MVQRATEKGERGSRAKDPREGKEMRCLIRTDGGPVMYLVRCDPYGYGSLGGQALHERREDLRRAVPEVRERRERVKMATNQRKRVQRQRSGFGVRS